MLLLLGISLNLFSLLIGKKAKTMLRTSLKLAGEQFEHDFVGKKKERCWISD